MVAKRRCGLDSAAPVGSWRVRYAAVRDQAEAGPKRRFGPGNETALAVERCAQGGGSG